MIKTVWYYHKDRNIDQGGKEIRNIYNLVYIVKLFPMKCQEHIMGEWTVSPTNDLGKQNLCKTVELEPYLIS